ncbi:MAG: hypothetical protein LBB38_02035 [Puniceicoccales bacterium]|nr:hypothetical protein [Puniceicoccales bacterium]
MIGNRYLTDLVFGVSHYVAVGAYKANHPNATSTEVADAVATAAKGGKLKPETLYAIGFAILSVLSGFIVLIIGLIWRAAHNAGMIECFKRNPADPRLAFYSSVFAEGDAADVKGPVQIVNGKFVVDPDFVARLKDNMTAVEFMEAFIDLAAGLGAAIADGFGIKNSVVRKGVAGENGKHDMTAGQALVMASGEHSNLVATDFPWNESPEKLLEVLLAVIAKSRTGMEIKLEEAKLEFEGTPPDKTKWVEAVELLIKAAKVLFALTDAFRDSAAAPAAPAAPATPATPAAPAAPADSDSADSAPAATAPKPKHKPALDSEQMRKAVDIFKASLAELQQ